MQDARGRKQLRAESGQASEYALEIEPLAFLPDWGRTDGHLDNRTLRVGESLKTLYFT
jgi:hypothetical protein